MKLYPLDKMYHRTIMLKYQVCWIKEYKGTGIVDYYLKVACIAMTEVSRE